MALPDSIDLARTAALGDPGTERGRQALGEIFQLYFDNVTVTCEAMRRAGSPDEVRRQAHRAKGASGMIGAMTIAGVFADLEARAAAGETIAGATYDDLERRLAALRQTLSAQIGLDLQ